MFRHSLKKQQKLNALVQMIGPLQEEQCLLITCGDNNGALNWHFRRNGGRWTWVDTERDSAKQIAELTGDAVLEMDKSNPELAFHDRQFEIVISIDVHEHLEDVTTLNRELARVAAEGGKVFVTTPTSDEGKLANRIKQLFGMRPEDYGHLVVGYDATQLTSQMEHAGLDPFASSSYSRFFTEMIEFLINVSYVKVLAKRAKAEVGAGQITPQNQGQLKSVGKSYRLYVLLYPILRIISLFDSLIWTQEGYAVIVAARKS